jgi:hypothetical protein
VAHRRRDPGQSSFDEGRLLPLLVFCRPALFVQSVELAQNPASGALLSAPPGRLRNGNPRRGASIKKRARHIKHLPPVIQRECPRARLVTVTEKAHLHGIKRLGALGSLGDYPIPRLALLLRRVFVSRVRQAPFRGKWPAFTSLHWITSDQVLVLG